jgi:hypothetical protein
VPYNPWSGITLVTAPTAAPVSIADLKAHSRIYQEADDSLLGAYINMATISCQHRCRRAFMPQVWRLALNQWPGRSPAAGFREAADLHQYYKWNFIEIPLPPLTSIISFQYLDTNANVYYMTQSVGVAVGDYLLDTSPEPGRVNLPFSGIWPTTILLPTSAITITFGCGYPAYRLSVNVDQTGIATFAATPLSITGITGPTLIANSTIWSATLTTSSSLVGWSAGQSAYFTSSTDPTWVGLYVVQSVNGVAGTITITGSQSVLNQLPLPFSAGGTGTLTAAFDPMLVGTWVTLTVPATAASLAQTGSYNAAMLSPDLTQLQLVLQQPTPITLPLTGASAILTGSVVPQDLRSAIVFLAAHFYENREPIVTGRSETAIEVPDTIDAMLEPHKIRETG